MRLYSTRLFDCKHRLDAALCSDIKAALVHYGALHLVNTHLKTEADLTSIRNHLGFADTALFKEGGRTTEKKQPKWVNHYLRNMDHYPAHLYLLPNNEVQYQKAFPRTILFYCDTPAATGGRTFLHQAKRVEAKLLASGPRGKKLIHKLRHLDMVFTVGYLCQHHPAKSDNYFMSWQEKFNTQDIEHALEKANQLPLEIDDAWIKKETSHCHSHPSGTCPTLMTRIALPNFVFDPLTQATYLRFPRIAMTPPDIVNGHRSYCLSDGSCLSDDENNLLRQVYLDTREGGAWSHGDVILFDNIRYGHSREAFTGDRRVLVGMADKYTLNGAIAEPHHLPPTQHSRKNYPIMHQPPLLTHEPRYTMPIASVQWQQTLSSRVLDAKGMLENLDFQAIQAEFDTHGFLHLVNTGLDKYTPNTLPETILERLGFGETRQFVWGGLTSGRTTRGYLSKYMRTVDYYPKDLFLLPHNEILYQHQMPSKLLFFYASKTTPDTGGRTLVHSSVSLHHILSSSRLGRDLLKKLAEYGLMIETGFIDNQHPLRHENYFRSWQERFETEDPAIALSACKRATHQFDACWWHEEKDSAPPYYNTLMTRITVPAFKTHVDGEPYLLFPRIAYDGPMLHNGHRRFLLGDETELSLAENNLLLQAYWDTRQGQYTQPGDIILVDNIRYGHSREPFSGTRSVGVTMADPTWSDKMVEKEKA